MKVGIIDADLIGRAKHRFPNLACEKISAFHKEMGDEVSLLMSYEDIGSFEKVYISKVFTDTPIPEWLVSYVDGDYPGESYPEFSPNFISSKNTVENAGLIFIFKNVRILI